MTVFTIETLNALGARLFDHADSITNRARHDMEVEPASCSPSLKLRNPAILHRRDSRGGPYTAGRCYPTRPDRGLG
jgi:hypothetical protein